MGLDVLPAGPPAVHLLGRSPFMASSTATRRSGGSRECPAKDERGDRSANRRRFTNTAEEQDPHFPQRFPGGKEGPSDFSSHCLKSSASSQRHGEMGPLRNRAKASTQGVPPQLNGPPDDWTWHQVHRDGILEAAHLWPLSVADCGT